MSDVFFDAPNGLDGAFLSLTERVRVSKRVMTAFSRLGGDSSVLVHKAERDLWSLEKDPTGSVFVRRLFDETGEPLRLTNANGSGAGRTASSQRPQVATCEGGQTQVSVSLGGKTATFDLASSAGVQGFMACLRRAGL